MVLGQLFPDPGPLQMRVQFLPGFQHQTRRKGGLGKTKKRMERGERERERAGEGVRAAEVRAESTGAPFRVLSA